jgi:hypothetical protein
MALSKNAGRTVVPGEVWNDLQADVTRILTTGANKPTAGFLKDPATASSINIGLTWDFSPSAMNEGWANFQIPHSIKPGSVVYPHVHWYPASTNVGVVQWGMEYRIGDIHSSISAGATLYGSTATNGTLQHLITDFGSVAGCSPSCLMACRFFREATSTVDTFTGDAQLVFSDVHYLSDRDGSTQRNGPWDT